MKKFIYICLSACCIYPNIGWAAKPAEKKDAKQEAPPAQNVDQKKNPPPLPNIDPAQLAFLIAQDQLRLSKIAVGPKTAYERRRVATRLQTHRRLMDRLVPPKPEVPGATVKATVEKKVEAITPEAPKSGA